MSESRHFQARQEGALLFVAASLMPGIGWAHLWSSKRLQR
jgi:hypothetical protein